MNASGRIDPGFEPIVARLEAEADEGIFHTACQLVVIHRGEVVCDAAVGRTHRHEPFTPETISALYCTAKPLLTMAMLHLVAAGEVGLDDRLGDVIDGLDDEGEGTKWIADRTIEEVLAHTAGLHGLSSIIARVLPERSRWGWIVGVTPAAGWRFGVDRAYSEFAGWYVLGRALESLTGEPYDVAIDRIVLDAYGVDRDDLVVRFDVDRFTRLVPRVSASLDLTDLRPVPLLAEVGVETACEWNPAFGSYGTMSALAACYRGILDDLDGAGRVAPAELIRAAAAPRLPVAFDPTLQRDACFGLGFMAPLAAHEFGDEPSDTSFGHAGQGGTSFAFCDMSHGLVVAALFNAGLDAETALNFRRRQLIGPIYRALSLLDGGP